jgi:V/A-type H+/Na+-transporting ATPase subunit I
MIARMKKTTVLIRAAARDEALLELGRLGVVHLQPLQPPANLRTAQVEEGLQLLDQALALLSPSPPPTPADAAWPSSGQVTDALQTARKIVEAFQERERLRDQCEQRRQAQERERFLGTFDPKTLTELEGKGIHVRLYEGPASARAAFGSRPEVHVVGREGGRILLALITPDPAKTLPLPQRTWPGQSLFELKGREEECERKFKRVEEQIGTFQDQAGLLRSSRARMSDDLAFERARAGLGSEPGLVYLEGFCPGSRLKLLEAAARRWGWALRVGEPGANDPVPTLVKSSRWGALFEPVMRFLGIVPSYCDYDTNGMFLVFFSLFFAMILGDAGYGVLLLAGTYVAPRFRGRFPRSTVLLFRTLAATTILWGALTGMWFGVEAAGRLPILRALVVPSLEAFSPDTDFLIRFCLILGALHLILAHGWVALRKASWASLAEGGWVAILLGLYFIADWLLLGHPPPRFLTQIIVAGGLLLILFGEQENGFSVRTAGRNLLNLPLLVLTGLGSFSDVISYLRLFAVGMAGNQIEIAFNQLAVQSGWESVGAALLSVCILLFGHTLNVLLGVMGVLVHGVRLNLLEFSRHLNASWSGRPFRPFRLHDGTNVGMPRSVGP